MFGFPSLKRLGLTVITYVLFKCFRFRISFTWTVTLYDVPGKGVLSTKNCVVYIFPLKWSMQNWFLGVGNIHKVCGSHSLTWGDITVEIQLGLGSAVVKRSEYTSLMKYLTDVVEEELLFNNTVPIFVLLAASARTSNIYRCWKLHVSTRCKAEIDHIIWNKIFAILKNSYLRQRINFMSKFSSLV